MSKFSAKRKAAHFLAAITVSLCCFLPNPSHATLILPLRYNNCIYIASDGMVSSNQSNSTSFWTTKCFPISDTGCVAISGMYGMAFTSASTHAHEVQTELSLKLSEISSNQCKKHADFYQSVSDVKLGFGPFYISHVPSVGLTQSSASVLHFVGCDTQSNFIDVIMRFDFWKFHQTSQFITNRTFAPITGEGKFISDLLLNEKYKTDLVVSSELSHTISDLTDTNKICAEKDIISTLLQLMNLHREMASRYFDGEGEVGPPYLIYRISTTNVTRVYYGNGDQGTQKTLLVVYVILLVVIASILAVALMQRRRVALAGP